MGLLSWMKRNMSESTHVDAIEKRIQFELDENWHERFLADLESWRLRGGASGGDARNAR